MNSVDLRQQILFACGEGDDNTSLLYDFGLVHFLFLRSIEAGLQDESIRTNIRPFLKDPNVTDEVLIQKMSMASSAEKETGDWGLAAWRADVNTSAPQKWASCQFPNPVMVESKH